VVKVRNADSYDKLSAELSDEKNMNLIIDEYNAKLENKN
jgi:hypothetical protein